MVDILKSSFDEYFDTLSRIGYISKNEASLLLISYFLKQYIYSTYTKITEDKVKQIQEMFDCIVEHSCTIDNLPGLYFTDSETQIPGNIVTQQNIPVITIDGSAHVVSQSGQTQSFSDFAYQAALGSEDFLAGYDSTLNQNIRVNAGSLVVTWQTL